MSMAALASSKSRGPWDERPRSASVLEESDHCEHYWQCEIWSSTTLQVLTNALTAHVDY
jgi:hypothetical protein